MKVSAYEIPQAAKGEPAEKPAKTKDLQEKNPAVIALGGLKDRRTEQLR